MGIPKIVCCSFTPVPRPVITVPPCAPALTDASSTVLPQPLRTMLTMSDVLGILLTPLGTRLAPHERTECHQGHYRRQRDQCHQPETVQQRVAVAGGSG